MGRPSKYPEEFLREAVEFFRISRDSVQIVRERHFKDDSRTPRSAGR